MLVSICKVLIIMMLLFFYYIEEELFLTTHSETSNIFGNAIFVCADEEHEDINITWYVNERPLDDLNLTGVHAGRNYDSCGCVIFTNLSLEYNGYTIQCRDYNSASGHTRISNIISITIPGMLVTI